MTLPAVAAQRGIDEYTWSALQNSVFPGARAESIALAVDYCKARKLDVMKKPCHIVPMYVKDQQTGQSSWRDVIMPGIYEQRTTAFKTGQMGGQDDPVFGPLINYRGVEAPEWCRVTVYRFINGQRCAFTHTEYFAEACAVTKQGDINSMWTRRPRGQLAKCAEAGALRKAFPDELGGVMTAEEVQEADNAPVVHTEPVHDRTMPSVPASEEQIAELRDLLSRTGKEEGRMLAFVGAARMEDMAAKKADELIATLRKHAPAAEPPAPVQPEAETAPEGSYEPGEDIPL